MGRCSRHSASLHAGLSTIAPPALWPAAAPAANGGEGVWCPRRRVAALWRRYLNGPIRKPFRAAGNGAGWGGPGCRGEKPQGKRERRASPELHERRKKRQCCRVKARATAKARTGGGRSLNSKAIQKSRKRDFKRGFGGTFKKKGKGAHPKGGRYEGKFKGEIQRRNSKAKFKGEIQRQRQPIEKRPRTAQKATRRVPREGKSNGEDAGQRSPLRGCLT